jgi:UDP-2-acetamido-3-amino-2,3-dideoxy-glucuronate N-acetyltransferase
VFTNVINPRSHVSRKSEYRRTLVRRGASIGANATIVCGVRLGRLSMVAAGATVTRSVADQQLVAGSPARHRGWVCRCGNVVSRDEQAPADLRCAGCQEGDG